MTIETNSSTDSAENGDQSTGVMQNNDAGQSQETASSTAPKEGEKLLKQSEVNDIVKSVKQKTEERTRANILAESYATAQSAKENNLTKPNGSINYKIMARVRSPFGLDRTYYLTASGPLTFPIFIRGFAGGR